MNMLVFLLTILAGFFFALVLAKYIWSAIATLLKLTANLMVIAGLILFLKVAAGLVWCENLT